MTTPQNKPPLPQSKSSIQTTRFKAALKWNDYLVEDLHPSAEGWEMSMALKDLAAKYEAYDETPHPFGDGYNIRWKRFFVLVFQEMLRGLPNGVVELEKAIESLERPAAPNQVGPAIIRAAPNVTPAVNVKNADLVNNTANVNSTAYVNDPPVANSTAMVNSNVNNTGNASNAFSTNHPSANAANAANPNPNSKKRLAEAMDPGGNNRDALHPNKRLMTQTSDSAVLPPGTFFSVDTQSDYTVRCVQGAAPTFEFKASGPAKVHFDMGYSGVPAIAAFGAAPWAPVGAAAQVSDPMPAQASCAPGAVAAPGVVSAPGASFTIQAPGATAGAVQVGPRVPPAGALTPVSGAVPAQEPGTLAASGVLGVLNAPGGPVATSGGQAEAPGAANGVFTAPSGAHAAPAYVVPANARPPPAVVAFARRASNASPDVDNAKPRTGWEEMGFREDSIPSSENTRSDSDVA